MNNIYEKILNLELELNKNKEELNNLIKESNNLNDSLIKDKINFLEIEIKHLNNQLNMFKNNLNMKNPQINQNQIKAIPKTQIKEQKDLRNNSKNIENIIGKSFMGIAASILIFISIILLSSLVYPYLTDTLKIITMFIISGIFTTIGLVNLNKDKDNKLYLSLSSCGLGAFYISLFLTNIYFKLIGDIFLYILLFVWSLSILFLSKLNSKIFQIIGQIGILISTIMGGINCLNTNNFQMLNILTIYTIISSIVYFIGFRKNNANENNISLIFSTIYNFLLANFITNMYFNKVSFIAIVLILYIAIFIIYQIFIFKENSKTFNILKDITNSFNTLIIYLLIYNQFEKFSTSCLIVTPIILLLFIINQIKQEKNTKYIYDIFLLVLFFFSFIEINFIKDYLHIVIPSIMLLSYSYLKNNKIYKYISFLYFLYYLLFSDIALASFIIQGFLFLIASIYFLGNKYEEDVKNIIYILFLIFIVKSGYELLDISLIKDKYILKDSIILIITSIIHIFSCKTILKNLKTKEINKKTQIIFDIITSILMIYSLCNLDNFFVLKDYIIVYILLILTSYAIFFINTSNLLNKHKGLLPGFYIGIKFSFLTFLILNAIDINAYIISISLLSLAIIFIILGTIFKYKSLRFYGLILSILSIVKLIMFDFVHKNTIQTALSFFVCGLLCFFISLIYNKIDKKLGE